MNISPRYSSFPISKNGNATEKNKNQKISFGCRIMAFVKSGQLNDEDKLIRSDCLKDSPNSLKNQSLPGMVQRNGIGDHFNVEDLFRAYYKGGQRHGWGIATHVKNILNPIIRKGKDPASEDPNYDKAVTDLVGAGGEDLMAHIRYASPECKTVSLNNAHPFSYQNWSFIHNGMVDATKKPEFQKQINDKYFKLLGDKPKGDTDSESTFYYIMGRMKEKYGTTDSAKIGVDATKQIFVEAMIDLIDKSSQKMWPLDGAILDVKGKMDLSPPCNIIMQDGNMTMAMKKGHELMMGRYINDKGEKQYIVSSEMVSANHAHRNIEWLAIPEEHILTIAKNDKGILEPTLTPFTEIVKNYDKIRETKKPVK